MRMVCAIGFGLVLMAGGAGTVRAQNAGGINFFELFQQLDANSDTVIDRGEVPESGREAFDLLVKNADRNKDGKIDRDEYREMLTSLRDSSSSLSSRFAEVDKDGDGKISKGEFTGPEPLFAQIDRDGDGVITREEAARSQPGAGAGAAGANFARFAQRIRAMDKDSDGKVSKDEFTGPPEVFGRLDADKDGFLSRNEIPGGAAPGAPDRAMSRERLRAMDKDGDGKVSKDEFTGPAPLFDRLDTDSDGFLTPSEVRQPRPEPGKTRTRGESRPGADKT